MLCVRSAQQRATSSAAVRSFSSRRTSSRARAGQLRAQPARTPPARGDALTAAHNAQLARHRLAHARPYGAGSNAAKGVSRRKAAACAHAPRQSASLRSPCVSARKMLLPALLRYEGLQPAFPPSLFAPWMPARRLAARIQSGNACPAVPVDAHAAQRGVRARGDLHGLLQKVDAAGKVALIVGVIHRAHFLRIHPRAVQIDAAVLRAPPGGDLAEHGGGEHVLADALRPSCSPIKRSPLPLYRAAPS